MEASANDLAWLCTGYGIQPFLSYVDVLQNCKWSRDSPLGSNLQEESDWLVW